MPFHENSTHITSALAGANDPWTRTLWIRFIVKEELDFGVDSSMDLEASNAGVEVGFDVRANQDRVSENTVDIIGSNDASDRVGKTEGRRH